MSGPATTHPSMSLIVCGAPLTARTPDMVSELITAGWTVTVVGTPASAGWLDRDAVAGLTGEQARLDYRKPGEPRRGGRPDAVVVCPATFNTVNKAAAGAMDTYALGVLCEAIGAGVPVYAVPTVNDRLWGHPVWERSLALLAAAGVTFLDLRTGQPGARPVPSGTENEAVAQFDPLRIVSALA